MHKKHLNKDTVKLGFIGDIAPARFIRQAYEKKKFEPVTKKVRDFFVECDLTIANLESPIADSSSARSSDHMTFSGSPEILQSFSWIDIFVTANNHINDCGTAGIKETIENVAELESVTTGVFLGQYQPHRLTIDGINISLVTFTDMLNYPLENEGYNILRMTEAVLVEIKKASDFGDFVVVYAHVGSLFSSFPNPLTRAFLHRCVDAGAKLIVTVHSHVIGGLEEYKGVPIIHSLGDFYMDGSSRRRRTSMGVLVEINKLGAKVIDYDFFECSAGFKLSKTDKKLRRKQVKKLNYVNYVLKSFTNEKYHFIYRFLYKVEIFNHILSTLKFVMKERGVLGCLKIALARREETKRLFRWMFTDRTKLSRDDDALQKTKTHNISDI